MCNLPTDKQNALRRECTFKIEIVQEIWVTGVIIYLKITVLTLSYVLARLAQSVRPWRMVALLSALPPINAPRCHF